MKKIEINYDELYELYINQNLSIEQVANKLNVSYRTTQRAIKNFGLTKNQIQKSITRKQTNLNRYGVENTYQNNVDKIKQTKLEKYKDENYNNTDKQQATMLKRYGVKCGYNTGIAEETIIKRYGAKGSASNKIKEKMKQTNLEKYGVEYPIQNKEISNRIQNKIRQTNLNKYGVSHNWMRQDEKEKMKQTNLEKYGVPYFCMREECYSKNGFTVSKANQRISEILTNNSIQNELEFHIDNKSYDIHIINTNILIEINPTYTHNSTNVVWFHNSNREPITKDYHYNKTLLAKNNNYRCIHLWDWDDIDKIINLLRPKQKLYARKCEMKEVNKKDCNEFLNKYHLQNSCKGQDIRLGLYYKNELIQIMTFGKPRYNKSYEYELLRLCTKPEYSIIGGSERLFYYFIKNYNPLSIISYCDNSKFNGEVYSKLGFKLKDFGQPAKHWYNGNRHITDNLLRQRGFDQLFNENYGKGTSNEQLMLEHRICRNI